MQNLQEATLSNDFISRRIESSIHQSGYPQLKNISCESNGSTLILRGELPSYYQMQLALRVAVKEPWIDQVDNHIRIVPDCPDMNLVY
ncbi:BON domain-containing protein [Gimesia sp.]|uniref:BON domain-containing protein n=1 Tax=Gimesia sp. TaxID=2024833 RepID=UPI000C47EA5B|nr:BON domain-containing protein [Gimesia sp.]MAX38916.1 hypothetical protein [Gimesia sp.]HAH46037.1 hypothetical protein [Planctomycetaceae bacterium]HBL42765.1 hypothetical protein [Planctomycetaceae bacterium]|tara:strand:+ start:8017 stop:8280 length:264 start_codon:yes stop_codon:yes gene_type:complete